VNIENLNALQLPIVATEDQTHLGDALDVINRAELVTWRRRQILEELFSSALHGLLGGAA
jgi:hypothetical protein